MQTYLCTYMHITIISCDLHMYICIQEFGPSDTANRDKLSLVINAHTRAISCIAVNYDGTKVATASTKVNTSLTHQTL